MYTYTHGSTKHLSHRTQSADKKKWGFKRIYELVSTHVHASTRRIRALNYNTFLITIIVYHCVHIDLRKKSEFGDGVRSLPLH